jgi:F-type H+-transporting ATPase subunit a
MALGITANTLTMAFLPSGPVTPAVNPFSVTPVVAGGANATPLEQFELLRALAGVGSLGFDGAVPLTLVSLLLQLSLGALLFSLVRLLGGGWLQSGTELLVRTAGDFLVANATRAQLPALPLLLLLGLTLGSYNLVGLFPFGFTFSAHLLCTFFFAGAVFFGLNYISATRHRWRYFNLFLPSGTPFGLLPLIVLLEVVSYFSRPFSLAIRLFANMMAGHALLKILLGFVFRGLQGGLLPLLLALLGLAVIGLILAMEYMVALLQVFVFLTLVSLYLVDAHNPSAHLWL